MERTKHDDSRFQFPAQSLSSWRIIPREYDIDDIAIMFIEMAFEQGHKEGEFVLKPDSPEYAHLLAYLQKLG